MKDLLAWLALYHCPGLNHAHYTRMLQEIGPPEAILSASPHQLQSLGVKPGFAAELERCLRPDNAALLHARQDLEWQALDDNAIITLHDELYPPLLREIASPPPVLFTSGQLQALQLPQIAIIGSRSCSLYGRQAAAQFAEQLAAAGLSICSGLASGIDTAAHQATVSAGQTTVAVLGNGLDSIYPERNAALASAIRERGALISEFPRHAAPKPDHFPRRNRIISGMSLGVIVVEAALRSGSLITARLAMEQNREVFAVPGSIRSAQSRGCHRLIREGALLVESASEVIEAVSSLLGYQLDCTMRREHCRSLPAMSEAERQVLDLVGHDPVAVDTLLENAGLSLQRLSSALMQLELKSCIQLCAGGYIRC